MKYCLLELKQDVDSSKVLLTLDRPRSQIADNTLHLYEYKTIH